MKKPDKPGAAEWSGDQLRSLEEWRNLCFALERAQAENLVANCHEKFQFAKTYVVYGRDLEQTVADVAQSAAQGNYAFFAQRGIRVDNLTPAMANQMVRDWRGAVASKKTRLAEMFQGRFNEDIEDFIATPHHATRLILANSFDETDAVLAMRSWSDQEKAALEWSQTHAALADIKSQLADLSQRIDKLGRRLDGSGG